MSSTPHRHHGDWYEIRIQGRLDDRWSTWLDDLALSHTDDGTTFLRGPVADQAALHGLLNKLCDLGLPLLSITQTDPGDPIDPDVDNPRPAHPEPTHQETHMTATQHPRTVDRLPAADPMRRAATIVGWLFVVTYVTSIAAKIGFYPPLFDGNYVTGPGQDTRVLWGAFFEAILIVANIGTATAMYTVMKRRHPHLAISFVTARVMESVFIAAGILAVLTVVTLRQDYAAAGDQSAAGLAAVGDAFLAMQEWTFNLGPALVVGVGNGCILGWMMFRTGLVPRRLAVLGLIGGPLIIVSGSAAVLHLIEPGGAIQNLSAAPEFFWELGLGIYLIVKGFKTPSADVHGATDQPSATR